MWRRLHISRQVGGGAGSRWSRMLTRAVLSAARQSDRSSSTSPDGVAIEVMVADGPYADNQLPGSARRSAVRGDHWREKASLDPADD